MKAAVTSERPVAIAIFGSGYVGLVTGTCFAAAGVEVIGVDVDPANSRAIPLSTSRACRA